MSSIFAHRHARFTALTLLLLMLLAIMPAAPVTASPPAQNASTGGFLVFGGTVVGAPRVNVRDAPGVNGRILGKISNGERVAVVGRSGSWYLIRYPAAPVGLAWISANYVQLDGQKPPVAAQPTPVRQPAAQPAPRPQQAPQPAAPSLPDIQVEAPSLVDFNNGRFRWQWYGDQGQLNGVDWYTDILLFYKGDSTPYRTFVAEPGQVVQDGPFLTWGEPFNVQCNTEAVARIAVRANGQFIGWVSGASAPIDVGPKCSTGGGGGGGGAGGGGGSGGNGGGGGGGLCRNPNEPSFADCTNPDDADCAPCRGG